MNHHLSTELRSSERSDALGISGKLGIARNDDTLTHVHIKEQFLIRIIANEATHVPCANKLFNSGIC